MNPGPSEDYMALLRGEITSEEYIRRMKADVDQRLAQSPTRWRRFKKWAGFPEYEDLPRCSGCGEPVTIGEFPVYPWVCRNPVTPECWR